MALMAIGTEIMYFINVSAVTNTIVNVKPSDPWMGLSEVNYSAVGAWG